MKENFERTERIIGKDNLDKLSESKVILFGTGGVGGHCAEALVRAGIGEITLVDGDKVDKSNINRQLIATEKTVGQIKVDVMAQRLKEINSQVIVNSVHKFYNADNSQEFELEKYDYVVDAIDDVAAKIDIICKVKSFGGRVISSMGTGNKLEPTMLEVADIYKTSICPLARIMRKELRKKGIEELKVVYSKEEPIIKASPPGSISFVPSVAGLIIAGEVIKDLIEIKGE